MSHQGTSNERCEQQEQHTERSSEGNETASLLSCDSCDSEDSSLAACGSNDYTEYVDETGRTRQEEAVCEMDHDTRHGVSSRGANTQPGKAASTAPHKSEKPAAPRPDGLAFDMNEPWQRSLAGQLEKAQADAVQGKKKKNPSRRFGLMFLGHSESRDFGVEADQDADDVSLGTNSSTTIPVRGQFIHRMVMIGRRGERMNYRPADNEVIFQGEDTTAHTGKFELEQEDRNEVSQSSNRKSSKKNATNKTKKIPDQLPGRKTSIRHRMQAGAAEYQHPKYSNKKTSASHYLELEPSADYEDAATATDIMTMAPEDDPACFCMGYEVWDYVLPPPDIAETPKRLSKKRTTRLGRVDEVSTEPVTLSDEEERASCAEPEGSYVPYGEYYYGVQQRRCADL